MNLTPTILAAARAGDQTLLSQAVLSHTQKSVRSQLQPIEKEPKACELFRLEAKGDRVKVVNCYRFTTTHVGLVKGNRKMQVWEGYVDEEGMEISKPEGAEDYLVLKNGNVEVSNRLFSLQWNAYTLFQGKARFKEDRACWSRELCGKDDSQFERFVYGRSFE